MHTNTIRHNLIGDKHSVHASGIDGAVAKGLWRGNGREEDAKESDRTDDKNGSANGPALFKRVALLILVMLKVFGAVDVGMEEPKKVKFRLVCTVNGASIDDARNNRIC
jgi:hypothetical protein